MKRLTVTETIRRVDEIRALKSENRIEEADDATLALFVTIAHDIVDGEHSQTYLQGIASTALDLFRKPIKPVTDAEIQKYFACEAATAPDADSE